MIVCGRNTLAQFCEDYEELNDENIPFIKYPSKQILTYQKLTQYQLLVNFQSLFKKMGMHMHSIWNW